MDYAIILAIIFILSNTIAKPASVYHVGNLGQVVVPLSHRTLLVKLLPYQRCFDCQASQGLHIHSLVPTGAQSSSTVVIKKPDQIHNQDQDHGLYAGQRTRKIFNSAITRVQPLNKLKLKLDRSTLNSIEKYLPEILSEETFNEMAGLIEAGNAGISPENLETVENTTGEDNALENSSDILEIENTTEKTELMDDLYYTNSDNTKNAYQIADSKAIPKKVEYSVKSIPAKLDSKETLLEKVDNMEDSSNEAKYKEHPLRMVEPIPEFIEYSLIAEEKFVLIDQNYFDKQSGFHEQFNFALDEFERKLYVTNFVKFLNLTSAMKGDSGLSFVQSGLFLEMALMAVSTEADLEAKNEIDDNFGLNVSDLDKIKLINQVISTLPKSSDELKFRWSTRLVLRSGRQLSQKFTSGAAEALQLKIDHFEDSQTPDSMAQNLNRMIEEDSEGAIRDTFDEDDLSEDEEAVLITTLYFRAHWRFGPTLLNGTWNFRDSGNAPQRTIRMIRVNDIMKYVDLPEWDAEAIEIPYSTPGLSLLLLVPRGNSLRSLVGHVTAANLTIVTERMQTFRIAASLPLYTLRMTLLLPNKLQTMGISRIINASAAEDGSLRISQAVQRIMFWAEAGRNAYKDDGLEWDESPEMKIVVDRPYMFYVRWKNLSLMVGNFVL